MSAQSSIGQTRILLSFSSAYFHLARRLADDLQAANIEVRYDQWKGGGGVPAIQSDPSGVNDAVFVLPLLTPSVASKTWIGDEWKRTIYDEACTRRLPVLPVLVEGDRH